MRVRLSIISVISVLLFTGQLSAQLPQLPDSTFACRADSVLLDAGPGGFLVICGILTSKHKPFMRKPPRVGICVVYHRRSDNYSRLNLCYVFNAWIEQPDTIQTCYLYPVILSINTDTLQYQWSASDPDLVFSKPDRSAVEFVPNLDTTTVYVHITDSLNVLTCMDSVQIFLYPPHLF